MSGVTLLRAFLHLLFLAGVLEGAAAQTAVEGALRDTTGAALPGASVVLQGAEHTFALQTISDINGAFHFVPVEAGAYTLKAEANGFYTASYDFVLRPRQPFSLILELQKKEAVQQTVEVKAAYLSVDPEKTGSSYTFTQQDLDRFPDALTDSTNDLVTNLMPGASDSHDNFLAVRGTEFSLHEFINGVSFLENTQPQFSPGVSPQIFETVDLMTGGFTPEYGNRFGGVLDITTRSGADLGGHGDVNFRSATIDNYDLNTDYGGRYHVFGYYFFVDGFTSGRFLDPPEPKELYDFGKGSRATAQFDWHAGAKDSFKLLLMGGGDNFQQPNITEDQEVGRNAQRHLRQQTAILTWLTFSPETLLSTSIYERVGSDRVLPTTDPMTPFSTASRSALTLGIKSDLSHYWNGHFFKAGVDLVRLRENESFFFDSRGDPDMFPPFSGGLLGG
jgi:Carboxypeptidase regulatory-like domain